ncbi:hypothetical protein Tco_0945827 [Tanacetum coccineum]
MMPIWKDTSYFDSPSKQMSNDDPKSVVDDKKEDEDGSYDDIEKSQDDSITKQHNTADQHVNTASLRLNTGATHFESINDEHEPEIDLGNIPTSYAVPTTPHTRIHKDHPLQNVIGDMQSSVQTRRMKEPIPDHGFLSVIYEGKNHKDLHTCLFACFLSQEKPKRITKALSDPDWIEAMQEELLQFKL